MDMIPAVPHDHPLIDLIEVWLPRIQKCCLHIDSVRHIEELLEL